MNLDPPLKTDTRLIASGQSGMNRLLHATGLHITLLILISLAIYSNTFHVPFILDDEGSIQLLIPAHGLANYFKGWDGYNYLPNRAFGYFTFALNYEFGGLKLPGYHAVNLVIHTLTGLLVYSLVRQMFRTPYMQGSNTPPEYVRAFAFVVALFFVCHPIQTQAVTYIVQRLTSMTTMFYFAALVCYLRWRIADQKASNRPGWYILALLSTLLAMKTKEISFTLPAIIALFELLFFGMPNRMQILKMTPLLLTVLVIPLTTYYKIKPVIEAAGGKGSFLSDVNTQTYDIVQLTRPEYFFTQLSVIVTYLRLLFFPVNQHLDYDYPITRTILELRPLLSLLLLLSLVTLALYMVIKSRQSPVQSIQQPDTSTPALLRLASLGIFWFFITLSIESSIIVIKDVIYEHRLYLPSFGFFLSMTAFGALALKSLENRFKMARNLLITATACIALFLSIAAYSRNNVWGDWITFWSDNVAKAPAKARPHLILGIGYYYREDFANAMREYQEALRLKPNFIEAYYNMGLVHYAKKEYREAISMYMKVLGISAFDAKQFAQAYNDIGISYSELGEISQAVAAFAAAVKFNPEFVEYRINHAFALATAGNLDDALREYKTALSLAPGNSYALEAIKEVEMQKAGGGKPSSNPLRVPGKKQQVY